MFHYLLLNVFSKSQKEVLKKIFAPLVKLIRTYNRKKFAMSYYRSILKLINEWSRLQTESSNFYYRLSENNRDHLAWLISHITNVNHQTVTGYFNELEEDKQLRDHITNALKSADYGNDIQVEYGRRLGWYAFVRILKPRIVIETGIDHGVGSCVLAGALLRNAEEGKPGQYYGTEIRREAGKLFCAPYEATGKILYGDSIESLSLFNQSVDLFINDSDHSSDYEYREYQVIRDKLSSNAVILGDNSHVTDSLSKFSHESGRQFLFFKEIPANHWYPGAGIGISFKS